MNKKIKIYTYYNFLFWHYVVLELSCREIGKLCGASGSVIHRWLKKFNIKKLNTTQYRNKEWLYHQYINLKKSCNEIGKICRVYGDTIHYWLKKFNIPRRSNSEAQKITKNKSKYKAKISGKNSHLYGKRGKETPNWKEWDDLCYGQKHARIHKMLEEMGIDEPDICPICGKPRSKRNIDLMNIDHQYKENTLDYYYICRGCHIHKYHYLAGLVKNKKIKPIPNLIEDLLNLKTREEREKLLKDVISKYLK